MARVLQTFDSSSSSKVYEVREDDVGIIYCTCPGWRFQKLPKEARACKHMKLMGLRGDSHATGSAPKGTVIPERKRKKIPTVLTGPAGAAAKAKATRERKAVEAKGRLKKMPFGFMLSHEFEPERMKGEFVAEMKYDGALTMMADGRLFSRKGHDITARFPEVPKLQKVVLVGEMAIVDDATGTTDFERFLTRNTDDPTKIVLASRESPATFFVFDMLGRDGETWVALPFKTRRKLLEAYWKETSLSANIELVQQIDVSNPEEVATLVERCKGLGIEGVMVKNLEGVYEADKRTHHWMKAKVWLDGIFRIVNHGFTGTGDGYTVTIELENGEKQDVNCGSADMRKELADCSFGTRHTCPFDADVKYSKLSSSGKLRFPSLKRLVKK